MGTTLTGTTPQDTYDSLIKVTDNGPLSGTAKYLSDGLGNDSALALSTARVGVATSSPSYPLTIVGDAGLEGNESYLYFHSTYSIGNNARARMRAVGAGGGSGYGGDLRIDTRATNNAWNADVVTINYAGNVGIGTSAPECKLHVSGSASGSDVTLYIDNAAASTLNNSSRLKFSSDTGSSVSGGGAELNCLVVDAGNGAVDLLVKSWSGGAYTEKARFLAGGGLTFNGDTAAANALDDYEEGTWTMGVSFNGASVGVTFAVRTGTYTKIGRQVTVNGYAVLTSKGSSTGSAKITGLPYTIANTDSNYAPATLWLAGVSFADQFQSYGAVNTTTIDLRETTSLGVEGPLTDADFINSSTFMVNFTYFV